MRDGYFPRLSHQSRQISFASKIAIIGGGIIGSSGAWNLAKSGLTSELIVIEHDPTHEFAATPRAIGGIRFVQGLIENLKMSLYGRYVFKNFARELNIQEDFVDLNFHECGYLFLGTGNNFKAELEITLKLLKRI